MSEGLSWEFDQPFCSAVRVLVIGPVKRRWPSGAGTGFTFLATLVAARSLRPAGHGSVVLAMSLAGLMCHFPGPDT